MTASQRGRTSRRISRASGGFRSTRTGLLESTRRSTCDLFTSPDGIGETERAEGLPVPSINRRHRDLRQFDAVDATHIQRHHLAAVGLDAPREDVDAAIEAELVADGVLVEEVFAQIVLAGAELEALWR